MYRVFVFCALMLTTLPGCFLFGGGGDNGSIENVGTGDVAATGSPQLSDEAMFLAEMAAEEQDYDTAVAEYNRAIRADSTNVDAYIGLTRLHQQLATQYRDAGNIERALQEQTRALRVLSAYINRQLAPAASTTGIAVNPPDTSGAAPQQPSSQQPAMEAAPDSVQETP